MAGNSWQQPVAGQPSAGSPHPYSAVLVPEDSVGNTNWNPIDLTSVIPVGSRLASVQGYAKDSGGGTYYVYIAATSGASSIMTLQSESNGGNHWTSALISIPENRTLYWQGSNAALDAFYLELVAYYI